MPRIYHLWWFIALWILLFNHDDWIHDDENGVHDNIGALGDVGDDDEGKVFKDTNVSDIYILIDILIMCHLQLQELSHQESILYLK